MQAPQIYVRVNVDENPSEASWNIKSDHTQEWVFSEPQLFYNENEEYGMWVTLEAGTYTLFRNDSGGDGGIRVRMYDEYGGKVQDFHSWDYSASEASFSVWYSTPPEDSSDDSDDAAMITSVSVAAAFVVVAGGAMYVKRRRQRGVDGNEHEVSTVLSQSKGSHVAVPTTASP
eukprot:Rmarinus@m.22816